jgi:dephospho-CoA kinase
MVYFADKIVVGITGGVASGKSTALKAFAELDWNTISTDEIVSDLWSSDENLIRAVQDHWGKDEIFSRGNIDKEKIARIVFNNPVERVWLENIIHPLVRSKWVSHVEQSIGKLQVVEVPLLFEKNLEPYFSYIISVFVPVKVQFSRLFYRGFSKDEARSRIASQLSCDEKARKADVVFLGTGSDVFLSGQVQEFSRNFS